MRTLIIVAVALCSFCLHASHANAGIYILSGGMDALQSESNGGFGGGSGNGTGTISGDYDDLSKLLNYNITFSNLSSTVTNMHFHLGAAGVSGAPELNIPAPWTSPQIGTSILLNSSQEVNLLSGNWYVNIHTTNFGAGEIRGQVNVTAVPEPSSFGLCGFFVLAGGVLRCRRR